MFALQDNSIEKNWTTITKLKWNNELKSLIIKCMSEPDFSIKFSNSENYSYYWVLLEKYMDKYYNCKPEKPDKFVFLLLLTYPKKYILQLNSLLQLKIAFNELKYNGSSENSDFTCSGYYYSDANNCICSQHIDNVFEFQNNLSGTTFNVGSVCNDRHKVVSENDENYKLMKKAQRDRLEEKKNGWPEGYKAQQRLLKETNKNNTSIKNKKKDNCIIDNSYITNNICYRCNTQKIFSQSSKGIHGICSCISTDLKIKQKKIMNEIVNKIKMINCFKCSLETRKKYNDLCLICNQTYKSINCLKCFTKICINKDSDEKFCKQCIKTLKKCIDCESIIMFNESYKTRCSDCYKNVKQKEKNVEKVCENCNIEFEVSQEQQWRKICRNCYKKTVTNCERCDLSVKILNVKKDGPNKGKHFYKCDKCSLFKWL